MPQTRAFSRRLLRLATAVLMLATTAVATTDAWAEPTEMRILVRSADAKFIGSGVGGLNVTLTNANTGALLAHGQITGDTGNTEALMKTGQRRGSSSTKGNPASFQATLDLERPTRVKIAVTGPLDVPQSMQAATLTTWVVPGRDRVEPGLIMQMPGLIIDLIEYSRDGKNLTLTAKVNMMCGCPITQDGLWNADDFDVVAEVYEQDQRLTDATLTFTGQTSQFAGTVRAPRTGEFTLVVSVYQKSTGNTGVYEQPVRLD